MHRQATMANAGAIAVIDGSRISEPLLMQIQIALSRLALASCLGKLAGTVSLPTGGVGWA